MSILIQLMNEISRLTIHRNTMINSVASIKTPVGADKQAGWIVSTMLKKLEGIEEKYTRTLQELDNLLSSTAEITGLLQEISIQLKKYCRKDCVLSM